MRARGRSQNTRLSWLQPITAKGDSVVLSPWQLAYGLLSGVYEFALDVAFDNARLFFGGGGGSRTRVSTEFEEDLYIHIPSLLFIVL